MFYNHKTNNRRPHQSSAVVFQMSAPTATYETSSLASSYVGPEVRLACVFLYLYLRAAHSHTRTPRGGGWGRVCVNELSLHLGVGWGGGCWGSGGSLSCVHPETFTQHIMHPCINHRYKQQQQQPKKTGRGFLGLKVGWRDR